MTGDVRFKELCLAAHDPQRVARFWAEVLGLEARPHPRPGVVGLWRDDGPVLWVNPADDDKVEKNRVHPDLLVTSTERLVELGARAVAEHEGWTVMADPEGNELCAFPAPEPPRPGDPPALLFALCVDSAEPELLAAWWAERTGADVGPGPDRAPRWLHAVPGLGGVIWKFVRVDDERRSENRLHWDVEADVEVLVAAGATVARRPDDEIDWTVLHDPQGNVFCAFDPA
ncbi:MAG TPA: VOC family protein [Acidimicrobiales bacterium]|nr:VOC family protein [Acidimicrobiales bacterium]